MITVNNIFLNTYEVADLVRPPDMPHGMYRIKFEGKYVMINGRSEWYAMRSAKAAFRAHVHRQRWRMYNVFSASSNPADRYIVTSQDINNMIKELETNNVVEFVPIVYDNQ